MVRSLCVMADDERTARVVEETLVFYRETIHWLSQHHAAYARETSHDLRASERHNAIWKLSGQSIGAACTLVELLAQGYTTQTWPTLRAIHEADRLLVAVADPSEEDITRRWLADREISQHEARAAEQRQAIRISAAVEAAGGEPVTEDIEQLAKHIYRRMSQAAHHQRSVVDEAIDHDARTMFYGVDPSVARRFEYVVVGGGLLHEVLLLVGDALSTLWGPPFYAQHLSPMLRQFEPVLEGLDAYEFLAARDWGPSPREDV